MKYRTLALLMVSAFALTACGDDDDTTGPGTTASVRFVNASSTNAAVNGTVGGTSVASNIAFQNSGTACVNVPAGSQTVGFSAVGGTAIGTGATATFTAGQRYTVVLFGNGSTVVLPDNFTSPAAGSNAIRFINGTSTAADIFGTTATGAVSGSPTVANLAAFSATGGTSGTAGFNSYANTNVRWRMFNVGTTATARGDFTLGTLPTNNVTTVVFTPAATGGATGFMVNPC